MKKITTTHILYTKNRKKSKFILDKSEYNDKGKKQEYVFYGGGWKGKFSNGEEYISLTITDDNKDQFKYYVSKNPNRQNKRYPKYIIRKKKTKDTKAEIVGNLFDNGTFLNGNINIEGEKFNICLVPVAKFKPRSPDYHIYIHLNAKEEETKVNKAYKKKAVPVAEDEV